MLNIAFDQIMLILKAVGYPDESYMSKLSEEERSFFKFRSQTSKKADFAEHFRLICQSNKEKVKISEKSMLNIF